MGETKTYKVAILPTVETTGLENKKVSKEMIDGALAYNPKVKRAFLYLNQYSAHGSAGMHNAETVGEILRTFIDEVDGEKYVMAEVKPNRKYEGTKFEEVVEVYPMRSADLWPKKLIPNSQNEWNLISVALCGQQPSVLNLPPVAYSVGALPGVMQFSVNTNYERAEAENFIDTHLPQLPLEWREEAVMLATNLGSENREEYLNALKAHFAIKPVRTEAVVRQPAANEPGSMNDAIIQFATENKLDLKTEDGFNKAEAGAYKKYRELWRNR